MLKEAIETIVEHATGKVLTAHGNAYSRHELTELVSPDATCVPVDLHTLSGFADYVGSKLDVWQPTKEGGGDDSETVRPAAIFVEGPTKVSLCSALYGEFRQRETFATCEPFKSKPFPFGRYLSAEEFVVALQAGFVSDDMTAGILRVVGNLRAEAVTTVEDDGVSQHVTAKSGVARVERVEVPNPVELAPFRTFQEVEQPSSRYVLRLRRDGEDGLPESALFEVLDDLWQVSAIEEIRGFLAGRIGDVPIFA